MTIKQEKNLKIFLSLLSMVCVLYIVSTLFKRAKVDFTEEGLYTLSSGTKSILGKMDSPVKLKLYYSKTAANKGTEGLRAFNNYFSYVKELLGEFVSKSQNQLSLEVIDPRPDTPEEEDAVAFGLKKFNISETENYFFGLVAENESGAEKIIEFFDPSQKDKLEYEVAKLIYRVQSPQKKTVGVLSSIDVLQSDENPYMAQLMRMQGKSVSGSWTVMKLAEEFYNVQKIDTKESDLTGIDTLVVIHPKGFSEKTLFAIDQFVLRGGNLLLFVDPNAISDRSMAANPYGGGGPSASPDEGFQKLMTKWGIQLKPGEFVGDKYLSGVGRTQMNQPPSRLLPVLNCNESCSEGFDEPIVAGLNNLSFIFPGVLSVEKSESFRGDSFLATTKKGNTYKPGGMELNNPRLLMQKFNEGTERVPLAFKIVGKFDSAFPDGRPEDSSTKTKGRVANKGSDSNTEKPQEVLKGSQKDSAIVVFPDIDFISDQFAFKKSFLGVSLANNNSTLFLNALEALSGDADLMSVRSKGSRDRSFDVINEIEFLAEKKTAAKVNQINGSISKFETELSQLGQQATQGNLALLQNEGLRKKKALAKNIALLKKELRSVKREGREKIEAIGKFFQYFNTLLVPFFVVLFGLWYSKRRLKKLFVTRA